jgi:hypothetical protein
VILELALAIRHGMPLSDIAALTHVYPTYATSVNQMAAEAAYEGARRYHGLIRPLLAWRRVVERLRALRRPA